MKMFFKYLIVVLMSISLWGCYDVINQPVGGKGGEAAIFSIAGNWVEKTKKTSLQIVETSQSDQFSFVYQENGRIWKGMVEASYYGEQVALNLDLLTLSLNDKKLIWADEPLFLLIGAYFKGDDLYIIEADMKQFRRSLAQFFYANPFEPGKFCVKSEDDLCKKSFADKYVLSPKNSKKFNDEFDKKFKRIFPKEKALIFNPAE